MTALLFLLGFFGILGSILLLIVQNMREKSFALPIITGVLSFALLAGGLGTAYMNEQQSRQADSAAVSTVAPRTTTVNPVDSSVTAWNESILQSDDAVLSEPAVTPVPTPSPTPSLTATVHGTDRTISLPSGTLVWLSATGEKFHSQNDCGNMNPNKARQVTVDEAISQGFDACENCW